MNTIPATNKPGTRPTCAAVVDCNKPATLYKTANRTIPFTRYRLTESSGTAVWTGGARQNRRSRSKPTLSTLRPHAIPVTAINKTVLAPFFVISVLSVVNDSALRFLARENGWQLATGDGGRRGDFAANRPTRASAAKQDWNINDLTTGPAPTQLVRDWCGTSQSGAGSPHSILQPRPNRARGRNCVRVIRGKRLRLSASVVTSRRGRRVT